MLKTAFKEESTQPSVLNQCRPMNSYLTVRLMGQISVSS